MKLSKRLETVASLVDGDIIDIGCDHGLLDIYLVLNKEINVTATDISKNALESAIKNAKNYNVLDKINFILSDGLDKVEFKNETLIITGMGAHTIMNILENKKIKGNPFILSAHNNLSVLRKYIVSKGYSIINEIAILDKKWYIIMKCIKKKTTYTEIDYELGPFAKNNIEYLNYLLEKEEKISTKQNKKTSRLILIENEIKTLKK
jgi:Predicted SAM-dependent methyltransferase